MARGDDIEERLIDFAVMMIALCEKMPETRAGRHVAGQLVRSGTSPAPQYGEARGAESRRDFVHKLRICLKELNESRIWLEIAKRSNMASLPKLQPVLAECDELCRIISASIQTATARPSN